MKLGDISVQDIYILWAISAPILLFAGWWVTTKIQSDHIRIITRSLIISITCGFSGIGTDSAAIIVPTWALLITPELILNGIFGIIIWWVLVLAVYYVVSFIYKKLKKPLINRKRIDCMKNHNKHFKNDSAR